MPKGRIGTPDAGGQPSGPGFAIHDEEGGGRRAYAFAGCSIPVSGRERSCSPRHREGSLPAQGTSRGRGTRARGAGMSLPWQDLRVEITSLGLVPL